MDFGFTAIPAIAVICYLAAAGVKTHGAFDKWIPVVCGTLGGMLGALAMAIMPGYPAGDYITAVAIGIVSGLAATGADQIIKQLGKDE